MNHLLLVATLTLLSSPSQPSTPPTPCSPLSSCTPLLPNSLSSCSHAQSEQSKRWKDEGKTNPEAHWKMAIETPRHQPIDSSLCLLVSDAFVILMRACFQFAMVFFSFLFLCQYQNPKTPCQSKVDVWIVFQDWLHIVFGRIAAVCSGVSLVYS